VCDKGQVIFVMSLFLYLANARLKIPSKSYRSNEELSMKIWVQGAVMVVG
jgi:hypothetical protein